MIKLPYYDNVQIVNVPHTDLQAEYVYNLNSINDPDQTSGGHRPRGANQWAVMFKDYQVHGCRYDVRFYPSDEGTNTTYAMNLICGTMIGVENFNTFFTLGSVLEFMEYPPDNRVKIRYMSRNQSTLSGLGLTPENSKSTRCKGYVDMHQVYRESKGIDSADATQHFNWPADYQASMTANPSALQQLMLFAQPRLMDGLSQKALPYIYATVKLVYYVELFNPIYPVASS